MLPHSQPFQINSPTSLRPPPPNILTALAQYPTYDAEWDPDEAGDAKRGSKDNKATRDSQKGKTGRVLVLLFDGMGNKFGQNSNVVRFFRALDNNYPGKQIVHYQSGISTCQKYELFKRTIDTLASAFGQAFLTDWNDDVKQGYIFLVQNYQPGDKICLFGFSSGAHTARVLAGMIYKVGILRKENIQQVDLAFNVYGTTRNQGFKLGREFKTRFTHITNPPLSVDFVGVWDTISPVGLIPRVHPYTSVNYAVKTFRHALALDEPRSRFRPNVWSEMSGRSEQDLDVDIPIPPAGDFIPQPKRKEKRDEWEYEPPDRDHADVKEVWFAGTHADVGGGSHYASYPNDLSFIPLRWMIKECILCETGILFDLRYLRSSLKFDFNDLGEEAKKRGIQLGDHYKDIERYADKLKGTTKSEKVQSREPTSGRETERRWLTHPAYEIWTWTYAQLVVFWWLQWFLEHITTLYKSYQENRAREQVCNVWWGRHIPIDKGKALVHRTVQKRLEMDQGGICGNKVYLPAKYLPLAYNWNYLEEHKKLKYID